MTEGGEGKKGKKARKRGWQKEKTKQTKNNNKKFLNREDTRGPELQSQVPQPRPQCAFSVTLPQHYLSAHTKGEPGRALGQIWPSTELLCQRGVQYKLASKYPNSRTITSA